MKAALTPRITQIFSINPRIPNGYGRKAMSEERESASAGFNRRKFMRRAGVTAAGVAVAAAGADALVKSPTTGAREPLAVEGLDPEGLVKPDPIPRENILAGEILSMGERRLVIDPVEPGSIEVELAPNAYIHREGPAPLSAYRPGDEVVVLGEKRGKIFVAVGVAPMFRTIDVTVYSRDGSLLYTSGGKVLLTPSTISKRWVAGSKRAEARPLADLGAGDEIKVAGMLNQRSQILSANAVGVLASDSVAT
jgi:hypothetical protein